MKQWMKWVLEGAAIYGALVLLMAFLWPGQKLQPEKNEITAVAETEEPGTEEEEEDPQPELSDWKTLSDVEVSEAIQEQGPDETLIFLESLTEEELEDLLSRETCLNQKFIQYRYECRPVEKSIKAGSIVAAADVGKIADILFPSKKFSFDAELLETKSFDTFYDYLNLLAGGRRPCHSDPEQQRIFHRETG